MHSLAQPTLARCRRLLRLLYLRPCRRPQEMKQRFWQEIHQGAKLFYLSGLLHGGYPKMEVHNLALYISRMKVRGGEAG